MRQLLLLFFVLSSFNLPASEIPRDDDPWAYPTLRATYRQWFAWEKAVSDGGDQDALVAELETAVRGTNPLLVMAAQCVNDTLPTTPLLHIDASNMLRKQALFNLENPTYAWGPQPLLNDFIYDTLQDDLPTYLIDQFGPDEVVGNATSAAEIYFVGLQEDFDRFFPPLIRRFEDARGEKTQQEAIAANLIFLACTISPEYLPEYRGAWYWFQDLYPESAERLQLITPRERKAVMRLAGRWSARYNRFGGGMEFSRLNKGNRRFGWYLLASEPVLSWEPLREIIFETGWGWWRWDKTRAFFLMLINDPARTLADRQAVIEWATMRDYRNDYIGEMMLECALDGEFQDAIPWMIIELFEGLPGDYDARMKPVLCQNRETLLSILRGALERERDPDRQLSISEILLYSRDKRSQPLVAEAAVSNLVDDDYHQNAVRSRWLLSRQGPASIDHLRAGIMVGAELGDWQMITMCHRLLLDMDPEYTPGEFPEAMVAMADNLRDDNVRNNGLAARDFLDACGEEAIPLLEHLIEDGDAQQRKYAGQILKWRGRE